MLARFVISRPITTIAACVLITVLAVVAYVRVPVALLPELRYPALVVWTAYPDVPPERVERSVTERVEEAVAGSSGLHQITARSQLGGSLIRLDFGWNTNLDLALLDVREQLDRLGDALPDEADRPIVLRLDPSERPIMMLAMREGRSGTVFASESETPQDLVALKTVAREVVSRRLEQLDGVARVRVTGGYDRSVDIRIDPARLSSHNISIDDVARAVSTANVSLPGGIIRRGPFQYAVEVSGEFRNVADIASTVVARTEGVPVRLQDVATVRESVVERRGLVRYDGDETLLLLVERRPESNTVRAAAEVRDAVGRLEEELASARIDIVVDESVFIRQAIGGVAEAVAVGGLLAVAVLFVFLHRARALAAVAVAIPLSLAITLVLFDFLNVSFNLISLSGLALGVGMLVDNAIVVVENIARLREQGMGAVEAAIKGTTEVAGAVTASTLTTIAVFLPLTFVEGLAGRLFRDQSLAVVCSLLASLVVALTVVPLIASRDHHLDKAASRGRGALRSQYERLLAWSMNRRATIMGISALMLIAATFVVLNVTREVVPRSEQGRAEITFVMPPASDLPPVDEQAAALERRLRQHGLAAHVLVDVGERDEARLDLDPRPPYEGELIVILPDGIRTDDVAQAMAGSMTASDVQIDVRPVRTQLEMLISPDEADLYIDLVADDRIAAEAAVGPFLDRLRARPQITNVRLADAHEVPAYRLSFNRDNLARFGVSPHSISPYLEAAARGRRATELRFVNEDIPIIIRSPEAGSMERLLEERFPTPAGLIPLGTFVSAERVMLPASLTRTGQTPVVRVLADVAPGGGLAQAQRAIDDVATTLPPTLRVRTGGATDAFSSGLSAALWSIMLSILLVYLILAAQFESLIQPFVVISAIPLAATGVAMVLLLTGQTINLMSLMGCVVLIGIVVNDAILMVDFINRRRTAGMDMLAAIMEAGRDRVRPIMMTTITTVLGLLPLAIGLGDGAELRQPLAIAIIGGLLAATLLTLIVVPVIYSLVVRGDTVTKR